MKNLRAAILTVFVAIPLLSTTSCKDSKKENNLDEGQTEMNNGKQSKNHSGDMYDHNGKTAMNLEFKDATIAEAFQHYIQIKTALVNSDNKEAKNGGDMLAKALDDKNLEIGNLASAIAGSDDLEKQREVFADLTKKMETILDGALSSGEIYKQYCPMAFNNQGGFWLSSEKAIRNPYFGNRMLQCGTIQVTIK